MAEISILCDWEEDPGVAEPALARAWAQIQIRVDGEPVTRFLSLRSSSVRDVVHGSALPLATWIVRNWWFLHNEGLRSLVALRRGREALSADPAQRAWLRRHNLLTAREGYALPDLSLFREEDRIHVCWAADPEDDFPRRGRFLGAGWRRLHVDAARAGLGAFVEAVLDRIEGIPSEDAEDLRAMWSVVQEAELDGDARRCDSPRATRGSTASSAAPWERGGSSAPHVLRKRAGFASGAHSTSGSTPASRSASSPALRPAGSNGRHGPSPPSSWLPPPGLSRSSSASAETARSAGSPAPSASTTP